jgi:hypothetical protein
MMTQRAHMPGTSWLGRLLRGLRPDRNPLRRGSDRAESVVLAALLAAFLAVAPFAAHAAGHWAATSAARQAQAQRASLTQVTAGASAGGTVRVWVDRTGQLANPPLTRDQVSGRFQLAAGTAVAGLAVVLAAAGWLTRRALDRRRLAGWDAEWLANGPRWSPRRLGPEVWD